MWFLPLSVKASNDLGIRIYLKNFDLFKDDEILTPFLYKMLDKILGEKAFALDVDYVDADLHPDNPEKLGMFPILELPKYIVLCKSDSASNNS